MGWPLAEALEAYAQRQREEALTQYRHEQLVWAMVAPHATKGRRARPPALPRILRQGRRPGSQNGDRA